MVATLLVQLIIAGLYKSKQSCNFRLNFMKPTIQFFLCVFIFLVWKKHQSRATFRAFNDTPSPPHQSPSASRANRNQAVPSEDIVGYITAEAEVHQDESASMMRPPPPAPPADSQDLLPSIVEEEGNKRNLVDIDLGE